MENEGKQGRESLTLIVNGLFVALAIVSEVAGAFGYDGTVPEGWVVYIPAIVALINMLIRRYRTNQPVNSWF